jgi:hypothetical protein
LDPLDPRNQSPIGLVTRSESLALFAHEIGDLLAIGVAGMKFDPMRVLAMFGSRDNWTQVHEGGRCWWAWTGPNVPPYELVQRVMREAQSDEPRAVQTQVCPVCRTVHDLPLCPRPTP